MARLLRLDLFACPLDPLNWWIGSYRVVFVLSLFDQIDTTLCFISEYPDSIFVS